MILKPGVEPKYEKVGARKQINMSRAYVSVGGDRSATLGIVGKQLLKEGFRTGRPDDFTRSLGARRFISSQQLRKANVCAHTERSDDCAACETHFLS